MKENEKRLIVDLDKDIFILIKSVASCKGLTVKKLIHDILKSYLNHTDVYITWKDEEE